jgi:DHA3 family macrolide efflux protein-like MFS transporter
VWPQRVRETTLFAAALIIVIGGSTALFYPVVWGQLQELTPAHMTGRVFTTFSTGSMAAAMAGMTGFGWAADAIGPAASLIGLGLVLLATAAVATQFSRRTMTTGLAGT